MFICSTRLEASIYDAWSYFRCGDEIGYLVGATTLIIYHILIHIGQMLHKSECLKVSINNDNCKHAVSYSLIVLRHKLYYYGTYVHNNMYLQEKFSICGQRLHMNIVFYLCTRRYIYTTLTCYIPCKRWHMSLLQVVPV